ncbi:uncharacterized protein B0H18DRAFT_829474, partial [Fomitopsis serialis]|uniref:uncharacterized protein n=1 Tax=Fomitopsis serialis TaxID=139415 RepID=UPI002008123E
EDNTCPACDKPLKSAQRLMAHLSSAQSCKWYRKGKNPEPRCEIPVLVHKAAPATDMDVDVDVEDFRDVLETRDLFWFTLPTSVNPPIPTEGEASSSSSTGCPAAQPFPNPPGPALDDDDDTRVEEEDELAGKAIRMEETIVETWRAYFREDKEGVDLDEEDRMDVDGEDEAQKPLDPNQKWRPFASELDWRVAMWVVREDVGQKSLNRFLSIPGVLEKLGLTFKDVRELFMKIDDIPEMAAWKTLSLVFPDRPDEKHLIQYQDILEAIKALLGNPSYAKYIVYRPKRI